VWIYAAALCGIAITAEALGLGGVPEHGAGIENILFIVLLLTFVVMVCKKFARH
jgi:uncharacterized membrane protein YtjA (UPF0391 family)